MSASKTCRAAQSAAKTELMATTHLKNIEIGKRSIRLFVSPAPVNFAERRSVLRALEQYGPVEFFKLMPGQGSAFISLMKESEAATKAVSSSPVNITVPSSCKVPRDTRIKKFGAAYTPVDEPRFGQSHQLYVTT
ncbi:hypothetical protein FVER53590_25843 [Fusarium verticillioides]|nr:hypothetical protein FVER53590_25843 [Fusarium verticillioides]